ncbi:hypothetical protein BDF14DRAFT_1079048 [Spinellus fusiger]|nr:hypothetical protein BDF14DRAFT_1079048 [Spinellus fusiger]
MLKKPLQKAESPAKKSGWKGISFKTKSHKRQSSTASFQSQESQASFESSSSSKPENSIHANDKRESSTKISEKGHSEKAATQLQNAPAVITNDSQYDSSDTPSLPVEEATVHRIQNNTPEKQLAPSGRSSMNEIESINEAFEGEFEREPSVKNIAKVFSQDTAFDSTFDSLWHEKTGIDATAEIEALGIRSVSSYPPSFAEETHQEPTTTSTEAKITQPDLVPISEKEEIFIHAEANSEEEEVISPTHQPKELIPLEETYKADMENKTDKTDKDTLEETSHFPEFITDEILPAHKRSDTTETSDLFSGFDMAHSPTIKNSSGLVVSDAFDMMFFSSKKTDSERMEESAVLTPVSTIEETEETDIATITTKSIDGGISILPKELGDENTVEDSQHLGEAKEDQHTTVEKEGSTSDSDNDQDHLGSVLPEIADSIRIQDAYTNKPLPIIDHEAISKEESMAAGDKAMKHPIEEPVDLDVFADNVAAIKEVDVRSIPINDLSPQKQAKADEQVEQGMHFLFDNQFMKAKTIFQKRDRTQVEEKHFRLVYQYLKHLYFI